MKLLLTFSYVSRMKNNVGVTEEIVLQRIKGSIEGAIVFVRQKTSTQNEIWESRVDISEAMISRLVEIEMEMRHE